MSEWDELPGDLRIPFIFVPHGSPEPTEWMAAHPGWVKFPATFVPRESPASDCAECRAAEQVAAVGTAAAAEAGPGLAVVEALEAAGGALAAWVAPLAPLAPLVAPLASLAVALAPSHTASPDLDEVHPGGEGFDRHPPLPPLPGLVPPATAPLRRPGEGGFAPPTPMPPNPGFGQATPLPGVLPGRPVEEQKPTILHQDRNDGLPAGLRSRSQRAREAARKADPEVTQALHDRDWEAHHLINVAGVQVAPDLVQAAKRAGWRVDEPGNVAPLPASPEAQQKLKDSGIDRPVHDSGHQQWNDEVANRLRSIERQLRKGPRPGSDAYNGQARQKLENLQNDLRREMMKARRLTQNVAADQTALA